LIIRKVLFCKYFRDLIEPTLDEIEGKMREAELAPHEGKRKVETLWPIFKIHHQKSRYIYDLYYKRKTISKELYEYCIKQSVADKNLIGKLKILIEISLLFLSVCFTFF
jgi:bud site selection protein 31